LRLSDPFVLDMRKTIRKFQLKPMGRSKVIFCRVSPHSFDASSKMWG
jgi:hypothetical protein